MSPDCKKCMGHLACFRSENRAAKAPLILGEEVKILASMAEKGEDPNKPSIEFFLNYLLPILPDLLTFDIAATAVFSLLRDHPTTLGMVDVAINGCLKDTDPAVVHAVQNILAQATGFLAVQDIEATFHRVHEYQSKVCSTTLPQFLRQYLASYDSHHDCVFIDREDPELAAVKDLAGTDPSKAKLRISEIMTRRKEEARADVQKLIDMPVVGGIN